MSVDAAAYEAFVRFVNPTMGHFLQMTGRARRWVRARGCEVEVEGGEVFEDWVAGYGTFNLGHNPPALKAALVGFLAEDTPTLFHDALNPWAGRLGEALVGAAGEGFETVLLGNSGAEAVEAAVKLAMLATGRPNIVYLEGAFHGVTLGALSCMGQGAFREGFESVLADFVCVPFDDVEALERALSAGDVAALIAEPIQMEGGARALSPGWFARARALCDAQGVLLICDEVQVGMGRTGTLFAFEQLGAVPDMVVLAKALGGGLVPISSVVVGQGLFERGCGDVLRAEILTSTYGGGALACAVALEALARLGDADLLAQVRRSGERLWSGLRGAVGGSRLVARIEGRGLVGGLALRDVDHPWFSWEDLGMPALAGMSVTAPLLIERLSRAGIMAHICGHDWSVLRIEPPLIVDEAAIDRFIEAVAEGVAWLEGF